MKKRIEIRIKEEWCKSCEICVRMCPRKVLEMEGFYPKVIALENCTACRICENMCPDFAIEVYVEQEESKLEK